MKIKITLEGSQQEVEAAREEFDTLASVAGAEMDSETAFTWGPEETILGTPRIRQEGEMTFGPDEEPEDDPYDEE